MKASFPPDFELRIKRDLGDSYQDFLQAMQSTPPVSLRYNPSKNRHHTYNQYDQVPWAKTGMYLPERPIFTLDPLFHSGAFYVQEASSMFLEQAITQVLAQHKDIIALDLCAAPGGKSTHLLSLLDSSCLVVSNEVIRQRNSILRENLQKWGHCNSIVTCNDPIDFQQTPALFDLIVIDAPCSGEGLFRKEDSAMQEWSTDNVMLCSARQKRIISDVWPALKQDGLIIYCTCTFNKEENENNLSWLTQQHDVEFIKLEVAKDWGIEVVERNDMIAYRFMPHHVRGEGFFLSVIQKKETENTSTSVKRKSFHPLADKQVHDGLHHWVFNPENKKFLLRDEVIRFFPNQHVEVLELLTTKLSVTSYGTPLAAVKKNKYVPEHALSLSNQLNANTFPQIPVDLQEALNYLHRDTPLLTTNEKGFNLISYNNTPLGWVNVLDNRINNLYPKDWRIRMDI